MVRPTIHWVMDRMQKHYGHIPRKPVLDPVDELIQTVLSQNTSDVNSARAYQNLVKTFPTWGVLLDADDAAVADAIRAGGLADVKAPRLKGILSQIMKRRGRLDLNFLKDLPLPEAREWLQRLPGVGPKTAACVLLFSLGMSALPVDTHVHRVSRRLGLVPQEANAEKAQEVLEKSVPVKDVYTFHLQMILHGRRVCRAIRPACDQCVLSKRCPSAQPKDSQ